MNPGLTIRPIASVAPTDAVRTAPVAGDNAVRTDLAPAQSVTVAPESTALRNDPALITNQRSVSRELVVDPEMREVIYRVVDVNSGEVIRQVPEKALLRLRAYTRALEEGFTAAEAFQESRSV